MKTGKEEMLAEILLIERLKVKGLNPKDFKSYIDSFRFGAAPHAGWGMGLENGRCGARFIPTAKNHRVSNRLDC